MPHKRNASDLQADAPDGDGAGVKPLAQARTVNVHVDVSEPFGVVALFVVALCLIWLLYRQMERNRA